MLWTILVVLCVLWLLGMVTSYTLGGFIHILLLVALAILVINLIQGRRPSFSNERKVMKPIMWVGILLIVLGGLAFVYQGFTYTHQEKVLDVGPIHATREDHERVSIPPMVGGLALVGGIALLVVGSKKSS